MNGQLTIIRYGDGFVAAYVEKSPSAAIFWPLGYGKFATIALREAKAALRAMESKK